MSYPFVAAHLQLGRRKGPVKAFLIHMAEGGGTVAYLAKPNPNNVSVHYVIERTGRIVQMVKESDASGSVNPNLIRKTDDADGFYGVTAAKAVMEDWWRDPNSAVISLEIEGFAASGPNPEQSVSLRKLVADVRTRHPDMGLLGHRDFASYKACPGKLIRWDELGGHGPAKETFVPGLTITDIVSEPGTVTVKDIPGVQAVQVDDPSQRFGMPPGSSKPTVAKGRLVGDPLGKDSPGNDRHTVRLIGQELAVLLDGQVTFAPTTTDDDVVTLSVNGQKKYEVRL